jgi:hypothetical protein
MPFYKISQYEVWKQDHIVEADNLDKALQKLYDGYTEPVEDSFEFVETPDYLGMPTDNLLEDTPSIYDNKDIVPSIRSVEKVSD